MLHHFGDVRKMARPEHQPARASGFFAVQSSFVGLDLRLERLRLWTLSEVQRKHNAHIEPFCP